MSYKYDYYSSGSKFSLQIFSSSSGHMLKLKTNDLDWAPSQAHWQRAGRSFKPSGVHSTGFEFRTIFEVQGPRMCYTGEPTPLVLKTSKLTSWHIWSECIPAPCSHWWYLQHTCCLSIVCATRVEWWVSLTFSHVDIYIFLIRICMLTKMVHGLICRMMYLQH
jgi:hypothetical protein